MYYPHHQHHHQNQNHKSHLEWPRRQILRTVTKGKNGYKSIVIPGNTMNENINML